MIDKKKALKIVDFEPFKLKELPENFKNISSKKEKYEKLPKDIKIIQS